MLFFSELYNQAVDAKKFGMKRSLHDRGTDVSTF
jgi:hypothetical protein